MSRAAAQAVGVVALAVLVMLGVVPWFVTSSPLVESDMAQRARVVVLGSSVAESHVDRAQLARGAGVDVEEVFTLQAPRTSLLHWGPMVERTFSRRGHRVDAIWVVTSVGQLIQHDASEVVARDTLLSVADDQTPSAYLAPLRLEARVLRSLLQLRARLNLDRVGILDRVAAAGPLGLLMLWPEDQRAVLEARYAAYAMSRFDAERLASSMHEAEFVRFEGVDPPNTDGLVAFLSRLGEVADEVVVVRVPFAPRNTRTDRYTDEVVREVADVVESTGATWIDASDVALSDTDFEDPFHLHPDAAPRFTEAVLKRVGRR